LQCGLTNNLPTLTDVNYIYFIATKKRLPVSQQITAKLSNLNDL